MKKWSSFFVFFYGRQSVCFSSHVYGVDLFMFPGYRLTSLVIFRVLVLLPFRVFGYWNVINMSLMVLLMFLLNHFNNYFTELTMSIHFLVLKIFRAVTLIIILNFYLVLSIFAGTKHKILSVRYMSFYFLSKF